MRRTTIMLSVAALALAGCGHKADTTNTTTVADDSAANTAMNTSVPTATSPGQTFANAAAASDAFEIATSQLAATSAKSAAVKAYAAKMIEAHTGSTAKLKAAAASASPAITPDATLTADQQATLTELKGKTGADFDTAYKTGQVNGHQMTLDALKAYSAGGDVATLKTFATGLIPTVAAHLNMAKALK